ncbi:GntR family transcriptional regulator [Actinomycetes bacterium KLBMP 9797]
MARKLRSTQVYDALREEIIEGALPPGSRLAARALALRFDSSDIPVREALWMLARDGLVQNTPYAGARVRQFTQREIEETYAVRGHLESLALKLGAGRLDAEQTANVKRVMGELDAALDAGNLVRYGRLNREFHEAILVGCPNQCLLDLIERLWDGQASYQMVFRLNPERARASQAEHREIVDAMFSGDGERAAKLIMAHRERGAQALAQTSLAQSEEELAQIEAEETIEP